MGILRDEGGSAAKEPKTGVIWEGDSGRVKRSSEGGGFSRSSFQQKNRITAGHIDDNPVPNNFAFAGY